MRKERQNNTKNIKEKNYKKAPLMPIHLRVFMAVVLGQIACGFALGISGTALSNASKYITINDLWTGLIGAGSLIGLAGSILIGRLSDKIGRRKLLMLNMYILGILSLMQLLTNNLPTLFIIRVLIGLMIAVDYTVGNALLTEWLPKGEDSKKQSHLLIYWTIGFIVSYLTGTFINGFGSHTWQIILATGAIPAFIAAIFRSIFPCLLHQAGLQAAVKSKQLIKLLKSIWGVNGEFLRDSKSLSQSKRFPGQYYFPGNIYVAL